MRKVREGTGENQRRGRKEREREGKGIAKPDTNDQILNSKGHQGIHKACNTIPHLIYFAV